MSVPDFNCVLKFLDQVKSAFVYKPKKYRRVQVLWQSYLKKKFVPKINTLSYFESE